MTLNEYEKLTDTDKAFLKLEGRCDGCGCKLKDQVFIVHAEWCKDVPQFIWPKANWDRGSDKFVIQSPRRAGKSVFANMIKAFNTIRNKDENTNS